MNRIAVIGCGGAGKSTLSRQLGEMLGIEVLHLDRLNWHPGWVPTPQPQWRHLVEEMVQKQSWIIDGNYSATLDIRLAAADTVVFLDFPRRVCLWRVLRRYFMHRNRTRPDMGDGCPERFPDREFLGWIWHFHKHSRLKILRMIDEHFTGNLIHLHSPSEVKRWLHELGPTLSKVGSISGG